ncbi:MAG: phosphomannomutase [Parcubacteria group bacterium Gr01-1014_107]|nr:MAG: phosphomannomutase [Parcubacteria group bacterium Gr01-1014_107]
MMTYLKTYSDFLRKRLKIKKPLKIVCDASNGTAGLVLKKVFIGASLIKMILINGKPNGRFPAHGPNPLSGGALDQASLWVRRKKADLGAVFDADGDRVFFIDNQGKPIPSFVTALLLFQSAKPPLVADEIVFQTIKAMKTLSVKSLFPSKVGSFFVKAEMRKRKANIAAETSGHFYFKDFFYADAGILTLIKICNFLSSSRERLSDLLKKIPRQVILTDEVKIHNRTWQKKLLYSPFLKKSKVVKRDGLTVLLSRGFLNVRASNTEPLLRLTCSLPTESQCRKIINSLKRHLR